MDDFRIEVPDLGEEFWDKFRESIISLEQEAFGEKSFSEEEMARDFTSKTTVAALLFHKTEIVGFTYAKPIEEADPSRISEKGQTAWIWDTVIKKEFQGRKLVGPMMTQLETELRKRGYQFVERQALMANNYAANIAKSYRDRIVKEEGPLDSFWGPQMFFRIRL